jgi:prolipoprotein diacylglyceryltransferase
MTIFALLVGLGASLGAWQVSRAARPGWEGRRVDAALGALAGMWIGGRAGYVGIHPAYYAAHPGEAWLPWGGGLTAWGALAGGLLAAGLAALALRRSLPDTLDGLSPLLPPLAVMGWLGCAAAGCAYGPAMAAGSFLAMPLPDEWGALAPRFPLQFAAALALVGYNGLAAAFIPPRAPAGLRAGLTGFGLAGIQFAGMLLSAEPAPRWNGLSYDAWAALILAALSLILMILTLWPRPRL